MVERRNISKKRRGGLPRTRRGCKGYAMIAVCVADRRKKKVQIVTRTGTAVAPAIRAVNEVVRGPLLERRGG